MVWKGHMCGGGTHGTDLVLRVTALLKIIIIIN
jgi:hypothetical protein